MHTFEIALQLATFTFLFYLTQIILPETFDVLILIKTK